MNSPIVRYMPAIFIINTPALLYLRIIPHLVQRAYYLLAAATSVTKHCTDNQAADITHKNGKDTINPTDQVNVRITNILIYIYNINKTSHNQHPPTRQELYLRYQK